MFSSYMVDTGNFHIFKAFVKHNNYNYTIENVIKNCVIINFVNSANRKYEEYFPVQFIYFLKQEIFICDS